MYFYLDVFLLEDFNFPDKNSQKHKSNVIVLFS